MGLFKAIGLLGHWPSGHGWAVLCGGLPWTRSPVIDPRIDPSSWIDRIDPDLSQMGSGMLRSQDLQLCGLSNVSGA